MNLDAVRTEIEGLRLHATPEEKAELDTLIFNAGSPWLCVYGQLSGHCYNKRAKELKILAGVNTYDLPYTPLEQYLLDCDCRGLHHINSAIIAYIKGETDTLPTL